MLRSIQIGICDRDQKDRDLYMEFCKKLGQRKNIPFKIKQYEGSGDLLFDMDSSATRDALDILLLEAEGHGQDGIETALILRDMGYGGQIVFLAKGNPGDRIETVFEAGGSDYILKSSTHRLETVLLKTVETVRELDEEYIRFNRVGEYRQVALSEILYFDVRNHLVCVYYKKESFEFLSTLTKVEMQLSERGFNRIHRLYVVSLDKIHRLTYTEAELSDGTRLPVSRKYYAPLKEALELWRRSNGQEVITI